MANVATKINCFLCSKDMREGDGTRMCTQNHPLFPRQGKTIKEIVLELLSCQEVFLKLFDGVELADVIGDNDELCGGCLEQVAICRVKQLQMETSCALVKFAKRDGLFRFSIY